ncbi:hypothetical protein P154DRAFT_280843 [Amniculicola lignicola CBS 123094]|uniref:Uncharacterized protein n=1 Tax=Amniculicola lignicola CBS 123094 TaxID=1392246 RepID=A0A6A5W7X6_9PLEO|nr:hypothetical protein P154DRAFT_280843 [Amniculicola lignicola CBS 123094]
MYSGQHGFPLKNFAPFSSIPFAKSPQPYIMAPQPPPRRKPSSYSTKLHYAEERIPHGRITKRRLVKSATKPALSRLKTGLFGVEPQGSVLRVSQNSSLKSPLLRLPAEIRNAIFKYALTRNSPFRVGKATDLRLESRFLGGSVSNKKRDCLSLLSVCRQTYAETALLPFRANSFSFGSSHLLRGWIHAQPVAHRKAVANLELKLHYLDWRVSSHSWNKCPALEGLQQVDVHFTRDRFLPLSYYANCSDEAKMLCEQNVHRWLRSSTAQPQNPKS